MQRGGQVAIERFGPKLRLVADVDEPTRNRGALILAPHATFEHVLEMQIAADVGDTPAKTLIALDRGSGNDAESIRLQGAELTRI